MFSPRKRESVHPWGRVVGKVSKVSTPGGGDNRSTHVSAGLVGNAAAFLPAALEIVETPPSPIGRAIALSLIAAFCAALAWASLGKVDMIASVQGRIIPIGRSEIVQPFDTGIVRAIHVTDGQTVKAGEVLIELDPTINDAELGHLESDLVAAQLDVARLHASLADGDPLAAFDPPEGGPAGLLATERQLLLDQTGEQRVKLAALDRQRAERGLFHGNVLSVCADSVDQRKPATDPGDNNKLNRPRQRAAGARPRLCRACLARPHRDGDRRHQDRRATGHQLPDVAVAPLQTGSPARAVSACIDSSLVVL